MDKESIIKTQGIFKPRSHVYLSHTVYEISTNPNKKGNSSLPLQANPEALSMVTFKSKEAFLTCLCVLTATHVSAVRTPEKKKPAPLCWVVLALPKLSPYLR